MRSVRILWTILFVIEFNLIVMITFTESAHFFGGTLNWNLTDLNKEKDSIMTVSVQQTYAWSGSNYPCELSIGNVGNPSCISSKCEYSIYSMSTTLTSCYFANTEPDLSIANVMTTVRVQKRDRFVLAFRSGIWSPLVFKTESPPSLTILIDLSIRSDNQRPNTPPNFTVAPLITIPVGQRKILQIPVRDADLDSVKCRWARNSSVIDECAGACRNIPNAQLHLSSKPIQNCIIDFTITTVGYYVVALQVEDYLISSPNGPPLSSIPLQFIIHAVNLSCIVPLIFGPFEHEALVLAEAEEAISLPIIGQAGCDKAMVHKFSALTRSSGMFLSSSITYLDAQRVSTVFDWTPTHSQIGQFERFCILAIDTTNVKSAEYCLNFHVVHTAKIKDIIDAGSNFLPYIASNDDRNLFQTSPVEDLSPQRQWNPLANINKIRRRRANGADKLILKNRRSDSSGLDNSSDELLIPGNIRTMIPTMDRNDKNQKIVTAVDDGSPPSLLMKVLGRIARSTGSSTSSDSNNRLAIGLGLGLGLGIPFLILLTIAGACLCCRLFPSSPFWQKVRRFFWQEDLFQCEVCSRGHSHQTNMEYSGTSNNKSRFYRENYPKDGSKWSSDGFDRLKSTSSNQSHFTVRTSTAMTKTARVSTTPQNAMTPVQADNPVSPTPTSNNQSSGGSILFQAYALQEHKPTPAFM